MEQRFKSGDRVTMTDDAARQFPNAKRTGRVTSLLGGHTIRVHRDGVKQPETWHESFWRHTATVSGEQK
jgi:hypothetical protein